MTDGPAPDICAEIDRLATLIEAAVARLARQKPCHDRLLPNSDLYLDFQLGAKWDPFAALDTDFLAELDTLILAGVRT